MRSGVTVEAECSGSVGFKCDARRLPRGLFLLTVLAVLSQTVSIHGQPALQTAVLTDQGFVARQQARTNMFTKAEAEGVQVGPTRFSLRASYSLEFNDNVNASETDPEGDLIQTPAVNLTVAVPVSERADLAFQIGIGYQVYWHNEDLSALTILPGSELAYDVQIKDVFLTVFDRISYTEDVSTAPDLANQTKFPRLDNTIGFQAMWLPGNWLMGGGYAYQIYHSTSDAFSYVNQSSHLPFLRAGYVFGNGAGNAGVEFSATLTDYTSSTNSNTSIVSFGPYVDWQLTDAIQASLRGGYAYIDNSLTILPDESFDTSSFYLGLNIDHQLTERITQHLTAVHGIRPSVAQGAALTEETGVIYQATWSVTDPASLRFDLGYVHGEQSVAAGFAPLETYDQWRFGLNLSYALTTRLSGGLTYALVTRDSNLPDRGYTQNRVTLELSYLFD